MGVRERQHAARPPSTLRERGVFPSRVETLARSGAKTPRSRRVLGIPAPNVWTSSTKVIPVAGPGVALLLILAVAAANAEVLDRIAAVVGSEPITSSEIDRQLRLEAFFNESPIDLSESSRRAALNRLIDQKLIEPEIRLSGFLDSDESELQAAFDELRRSQFAGRNFPRALETYELTEAEALDFYRRQAAFARYVRFRFRTDSSLSDDEVERQVEERVRELRAQERVVIVGSLARERPR